MRLIEGNHAADSQVWALTILGRRLGMTAAGVAVTCAPYGATCWDELSWQDAEALEHTLRGIVAAELEAGSDVELPASRFWEGPV